MQLSRFAILVVALVPATLPAQFKFDLGEGRELTVTQAVKVWDVASFQMSAPDSIEKRNDLYLRRGRIGLEGKLTEAMAFNIALAYDGIGKDPYAPTSGSPNSPDNKDVFIWDASWMFFFSPGLNLTLGYFRPQAGKEHISNEFFVLSFDKSLPDVQVRQHLLARSTGREKGANVGGLHLADGWSINYNVGLFDPSNPAIIGNGSLWSPLLAGRISFTLGEPEMTKYKLAYTQTYYGKRSGTSIGLNGARQGPTEVFNSNALYGVDILSNYGAFDFNAEYDWLYRETSLSDGTINPTTDKVYSIRRDTEFPSRTIRRLSLWRCIPARAANRRLWEKRIHGLISRDL
jgi:hypothetical protein